MDYQVIEGNMATMRAVDPSPKMVQMFARPTLLAMSGFEMPPTLERLTQCMEDDDSMVVWEVVPEGSTEAVGYAIYILHDGPPFVCFYTFSEQEELELAQDILLQLVHVFFRLTQETQICFYRDNPVDPAVHEALTEGGFDLFEDCPTIDTQIETCYVLERYTYDAYYGDDGGDDDYY